MYNKSRNKKTILSIACFISGPLLFLHLLGLQDIGSPAIAILLVISAIICLITGLFLLRPKQTTTSITFGVLDFGLGFVFMGIGIHGIIQADDIAIHVLYIVLSIILLASSYYLVVPKQKQESTKA